jgi:hypothetical protein
MPDSMMAWSPAERWGAATDTARERPAHGSSSGWTRLRMRSRKGLAVGALIRTGVES